MAAKTPKITTNLRVRGLEEVIERLNKIDANLTGKSLAEAVKASTKVVEDEIRARTPYDPKHRADKTGLHMRKTVRSWVSLSDLTKVTVTTGPNSKLWWLVEYGHKSPNEKTTPAHPFIRPAFEASADAAIETFWEKCDELIAKAGVTS